MVDGSRSESSKVSLSRVGDGMLRTFPQPFVAIASVLKAIGYIKETRMNTFDSLNHTTWECKYHVVFIPRYRKKVLYQQLRRELGTVLREIGQTAGERGIGAPSDGR